MRRRVAPNSSSGVGALWGIMKSIYTVAFSLVLLPTPLCAGNPVQAVPEQFLGSWGTSLADCGGKADDASLHIEAGRISYHGGSGPLRAVVVRGKKEVAWVAELTGEGQPWLDASAFVLSADGNQLTQRSGTEGEPFFRVRCSSILG